MLSFIKSNSNFFIFIFLMLLTIDGFLLIIKYRNYLESLPNLKLSSDKFKNYCLSFGSNYEYKLAIINLTIENISTKPVDITNIKLIYGSKTYLASPPEITASYNENIIPSINEEDSKFINIDTLLENILKNTSIPSSGRLSGYAFFEKNESFIDIKSCKIIIETPSKVFEKEITINSHTNETSDD